MRPTVQKWFPFVVALLFVAGTLGAWRISTNSFDEENKANFITVTNRLVGALTSQLDSYKNVLLQARGLFAARCDVRPIDFRRYIESMQLTDQYSGVQGIGFAPLLRDSRQVKDFENRMRASKLFNHFKVWGSQSSAAYIVPVGFIEPLDYRNERALGFDMYSDPNRIEAIDMALRSGQLITTGPVVIKQAGPDEDSRGFIIYQAVSCFSASQNTGLVYMPFRTSQFFENVFRSVDFTAHSIAFSVADLAPDGSEKAFYEYDKVPRAAHFSRKVFFAIGSRIWALEFKSLPNFVTWGTVWIPRFILWTGMLVALLVFWLLFTNFKQLRKLADSESELKVLYRDAREAVRSREEFLSIASHELKTPITSLQMQLQMTERGLTQAGSVAPERLSHLLRISSQQVRRLTELVDDLLDVSRIRTGKMTLRKEFFDLSELAQETVQRMRPLLQAAECVVRLDLTPLRGRWDRVRMEQVFTNLISNVIRHAPGSIVDISVVGDYPSIKIVVQDSGPGIPLEHQTRIFERFERVAGLKGAGGLGLGLYIVRGIIRAHGGEITVDSGVGQGTRFVVHLAAEASTSVGALPILPVSQNL